MDKEKTIQIVKERIISEHRKHKDLDWEEIAARKIYESVVKLFAISDVRGTCEHPREAREYIGMGELRCIVCGKEFS